MNVERISAFLHRSNTPLSWSFSERTRLFRYFVCTSLLSSDSTSRKTMLLIGKGRSCIYHHAIAFLCEGILGGGDLLCAAFPCVLYKLVICRTLEYSAWQTMLLLYVSRSPYAPHPHSGPELHCSSPPHAGGARPGQFF